MNSLWFLTLGMSGPAIILALPALTDALAALRVVLRSKRAVKEQPGPVQPLVFIVPAHNESLLIGRCVRSLLGQDYPRELLTVAVVADNCTDDTAAQARSLGATVLERSDPLAPGKGHAIGWAISQLHVASAAAVVIVDADTIVEPDYASALTRFAPLENKALQTFDGASNEFDTWLTRMAGLLTRSRYEISLPLKMHAGLNCPMTGDGLVLGTRLLSREPWDVRTITEGWELYTRLTIKGISIHYAADARLYAQETASLKDSGTQRQRWTAGKLSVLRLHWREILRQPGIPLVQRLDLLAELTNLGPVTRGMLGAVGVLIVVLVRPPLAVPLGLLLSSAFLQPVAYSAISLTRHPEPWKTIQAFLRLPQYAVWRLGVAMRLIGSENNRAWTRTKRSKE